RSPVTMALTTASAATAGQAVRATIKLQTSSGKPIAPEDLLIAHTRKLHLLIIDPTLTDYQHVHPEAGAERGTWTFSFTPRLGGTYRVFADFTPAATARGLYASADMAVSGVSSHESRGVKPLPQQGTERDGYRFALAPA